MIKRLFIAICVIFAFAATSHAQSDSISTGIRAVEGFYTDMTRTLVGKATEAKLAAFREASVDRANNASATIRSMRWLEVPGTRRYNRVRSVLEDYMDLQITAATELEIGDETLKELTQLKIKNLKLLGESVKYETYTPEQRQPVPGIDPVPHEKNRDEGEGIYFR